MMRLERRHIRPTLLGLAIAGAAYLFIPQCFTQRVILVNARDTAVENLTLLLKRNLQEEVPLWHGKLAASVTAYLGYDLGYGPSSYRLIAPEAGINIEFGYFTYSSRDMVVIGKDDTKAFYWDDTSPSCATADTANCLISLIIGPFRRHVCRPW